MLTTDAALRAEPATRRAVLLAAWLSLAPLCAVSWTAQAAAGPLSPDASGISAGDPSGQSAPDCNANGIPDAVDTSAIAFPLARATRVEGADFARAAAADLDGDGDTDLVTTRPLAVHFNSGDGRFAPATILADPLPVLTIGDFDGDGDHDIITGFETTARFWRNLGAGSFAAPAEIPLPVRLQQLSAADIDADGDIDVIAAGINTLAVLFNDGSATFVPGPVGHSSFVYPARLFTADFDLDGDLDVLLGDLTLLGVALNDGGGRLSEPQWLWEDGRGPAYAAGDLDGDGDLDLVAGDSFFGSVRIGLNDSGAFTTTQQVALRAVADLYVEDRDGDGDLDIVVLGNGEVTLLRNLGQGQFEAAAATPVFSSQIAVAGDFDGDRIPDTAVFGSWGFFAVLLGAADGSFVAPMTATTGDGPGTVATGDFDADGELDLAVTNLTAGTVSVIRRLNGTWSTPRDVAVGEMPHGIASGDLDADGDLDLVVGHTDSGFPTRIDSVSVLSNAGEGQFTRTLDLIAGSAPQEIVIADLDGDTRPDIIAGGMFSYVAVFRNEGGTFAARRDLPVQGSSRAIAVGDIDGDGDLDLAVASGPYGYHVTVLRNRGDASFAAQQLRIDAGEPVDVVFADLEPDGDLDLVTLTFYGRLVVATNPGSGHFADVVVNHLPVQGSRLAVGDIDHDGDPDLAVATQEGVIAVLRNSGAGIFTANDFFAAGASPAGARLADVVGDAGPDLVSLVSHADQVIVSANLTPPATSEDCDADRVPDECQVAENDCDGNAVPDHCQIDSDADTVPDACDLCAFDDDRIDADGDRRPDCADNCPAHANPHQTDTDGDSFGDACDLCPTDAFKREPGLCGCGRIETDRNGDGVLECSDECACDCSRDLMVTIDEIVLSVHIALGELTANRCRAADRDGDGAVTIAELIAGVQGALLGCP